MRGPGSGRAAPRWGPWRARTRQVTTGLHFLHIAAVLSYSETAPLGSPEAARQAQPSPDPDNKLHNGAIPGFPARSERRHFQIHRKII